MSASPHARARVTTWGIWIGLAVAALVALDFPWKSRVQDAGFDAYQTLSPRQIESMPAVVVAIDERSLAALGQWPWPRTILARLIDAINRYQPAAIGIDILMPEADRLSPERIIPEVAARDPALAAGLAALPSNDTVLAHAIAAAPVVLALAGTPAPTGRVLRVAPITVRNLRDEGADIPRMPGVARYEGALASLDVLDRAASGHGLLSVEPADGVLRRIPLLASIDGTLAPSFALELLRTAIKAPSLRIEAKGSEVRSVAVGDLVTATEPDAAVRVHYSHRDARRFVSAVDVLAGTVEPDRLRRDVLGVARADPDDEELPHRRTVSASQSSAPGTSSTTSTSGRAGRRTTITGSPRSRAASSLASVRRPPLSLVTRRSMAWRSIRSSSPASV